MHRGRFTSASKKHRAAAQWGDNCGRESRGDYISGSAGLLSGGGREGAGGAQEGAHGAAFTQLTRTDRGQ